MIIQSLVMICFLLGCDLFAFYLQLNLKAISHLAIAVLTAQLIVF